MKKTYYDLYLDKKIQELIINGVQKDIWIIPVTKEYLEDFNSNLDSDFIKPIDPQSEVAKLIESNQPCTFIQKQGFKFLFKII